MVRRADGSGTTFIFTNYLSKVSADWKSKVGEGTAVQWPVGLGGKGNEGVSAFVQRMPGSIGYVEYAYAKQNKLTHVMLKNSAGNFVAPRRYELQGGRCRCRLVQVSVLRDPDRSSPARIPGRSPAPPSS